MHNTTKLEKHRFSNLLGDGLDVIENDDGVEITDGRKTYEVLTPLEVTPFCAQAEIFFTWALKARRNPEKVQNPRAHFQRVEHDASIKIYLRDQETLKPSVTTIQATVYVKMLDHPTGIVLEPKELAGLICSQEPGKPGEWTVIRPFNLNHISEERRATVLQELNELILHLPTQKNQKLKTEEFGSHITVTPTEKRSYFKLIRGIHVKKCLGNKRYLISKSKGTNVLEDVENEKVGLEFTSKASWKTVSGTGENIDRSYGTEVYFGTVRKEGQNYVLELVEEPENPGEVLGFVIERRQELETIRKRYRVEGLQAAKI